MFNQGLIALVVIFATTQGNHARSLCEIMEGGVCFNPRYDARECLVKSGDYFCGNFGEQCCKRFRTDVVVTAPKQDNVCERLYGGTCFSPLTTNRKCVQYSVRDYAGLCGYLSNDRCCMKFDTDSTVVRPTIPPETDDDHECGIPIVSSGWRIVNGDDAPRGAWPWQVALKYNDVLNDHFCGGSILDSYWILTAAHCLDGKTYRDVQVVVGEHRQDRYDPNAVAHEVSIFYKHQLYRAGDDSSPNDIGLIRLKTPIKFNDYVKKVCLPTKRGYFDGKSDCWITGWGDTMGTANGYHLQQLNSRALTTSECRRIWGSKIKDSMICIGQPHEGACSGDSGGPMVCREAGRFYQVGVTSWGTTICRGRPSVYTRVYDFLDWMDNTKRRHNSFG